LKPNSQKQLVEAARSGHLESFAELYEGYYNAMTALAYSVLADRDLAEDAAQETFAIACRDLLKLKSKEKFSPWLAGICRNTAKQMLRSKAKTVSLNISASAQNQKDDYNTDIIRRAVWSLRAFDREPIVLRYYDNMPYEQISQLLGISVQAVNGRLTRAKRKIAKLLKRNGFTRDDYERF